MKTLEEIIKNLSDLPLADLFGIEFKPSKAKAVQAVKTSKGIKYEQIEARSEILSIPPRLKEFMDYFAEYIEHLNETIISKKREAKNRRDSDSDKYASAEDVIAELVHAISNVPVEYIAKENIAKLAILFSQINAVKDDDLDKTTPYYFHLERVMVSALQPNQEEELEEYKEKLIKDNKEKNVLLDNIVKAISELSRDEIVEVEFDALGPDMEGKILYAPKRILDILQDFERYCHLLFVMLQKNKDERISAERFVDGIREELSLEKFGGLDSEEVEKIVSLSDLLGANGLGSLSSNLANFAVVVADRKNNPNELIDAEKQKSTIDEYSDDVNVLRSIYFVHQRAQKYLINERSLKDQCEQYLSYLSAVLIKEAKIVVPPNAEKLPHLERDRLSNEKRTPWRDFFDSQASLEALENNKSLSLAKDKYDAVLKMYETLNDVTSPVKDRLIKFKNTFKDNRKVIEKLRDSAGITFLKVVASILTIGIAAPFLFSSKGSDFADNLEYELWRNKPGHHRK